MNTIIGINAYRIDADGWAFDDESVGLKRELFVAGADKIISKMVDNFLTPTNHIIILFSASDFPGRKVVLKWLREDVGGNWYAWDEQDMQGWLCPALFKYFKIAPRNIFVDIKEVKS